MSRNLKVLALVVALCCFVAFGLSGCAKEQVVKEETTVAEERAAAEAAAAAEEQEALLREQEELERVRLARELLLREAASFNDIYFDFDRYDLKPEARATLRDHADWLMQHTEFEAIIEGHCDERGTREYNLALGERRAQSTRDYLITLGVEKERLTTISYGEELPLDPGHNEEAWAKNRRCHFVVVTEEK
ncbi:MAG TPA: peptidoglycan-associated lipoprotein Pal [Deltaproteobacteria bacterium]|nr:peptidoglycan-associated lipoprotein Pal [Deltaproteobacteria bacterium]